MNKTNLALLDEYVKRMDDGGNWKELRGEFTTLVYNMQRGLHFTRNELSSVQFRLSMLREAVNDLNSHFM